MAKLYEPQSGILNVPYEPDETTKLLENPPRFKWMAAKLEEDHYTLQYSTSPNFEEGETSTVPYIPYNYHTLDEVLKPGVYFWRYALLEEGGQSDWSQVRSFTVPAGLPETPLPNREVRFAEASLTHPRLWLNEDEVASFRDELRVNGSYCAWDVFYSGSVQPWLERELIAEPLPYPDNVRVPKLWRKMYMDCQEALYAVRHLSVAGVILQDAEILTKAKTWLLHLTSWDTEGPTSRDYNDEAAFRVAGALAWGYDWLYDQLSSEERELVRQKLLRRAEQVAFHVIERSKIHQVPFDSHAVRSLSSVLTPCCIALLGEEPKAEEWLNYTLEYFSTLYTPWGGEDGGWAEGGMYWTTGMAFVTDAINLIKKFSGLDYFERPFFQETGQFPLYCFSADTKRASFGDQSNLGEYPILKTGFNIRQFAGVTGNGHYQWYYEQTKKNDTDPDSKFYNWGWWDFRFDEVMYRHDYPQIEAIEPINAEPLKWFRDVGWVAMHHRMDDPNEHIMLLTKSSKYGSVSHSHGDQNGFLLHAFGEPLAIESGYYNAFGTAMHKIWRRNTISTNNLLINGVGQYAGDNKVLNMAAYGVVETAESKPGHSFVRMDATAAYLENVPQLKRFVREIHFFNNAYFVVVDYVDLNEPAKVDWLFHTLHEMKLSGQSFRVVGEKAEMEGRFVYSSSGDLELSQTDEFTGVEPSEYEGLDRQWHLTASTKAARSHRIATLLVPMKKGDTKYVSYFMDDQDHGVHLYCTDNGVTHKVMIGKAY